MRPIILLLGVALAAILVASPGTAMAKACSAPKYPGSGYFTSLSVKKTSCKKGKKVALAHYQCRTKNGKKGKCGHKVLGYGCSEKRVSIPTEFDSKVTCKNGSKRVVFTYQQNV